MLTLLFNRFHCLCIGLILLFPAYAASERLLFFNGLSLPPSLIMLPDGEVLTMNELYAGFLFIPHHNSDVLVHDLDHHATFIYQTSNLSFINTMPADFVSLATSSSPVFYKPSQPDIIFSEFLATPGNMLYVSSGIKLLPAGGHQSEETDWDQDGIPDFTDNCSGEKNTAQLNTDEDSFGDVCDPVLDLLGNFNADETLGLDDCISALHITAGMLPLAEMQIAYESTGDNRIGTEDAINCLQVVGELLDPVIAR